MDVAKMTAKDSLRFFNDEVLCEFDTPVAERDDEYLSMLSRGSFIGGYYACFSTWIHILLGIKEDEKIDIDETIPMLEARGITVTDSLRESIAQLVEFTEDMEYFEKDYK